MANPMTTHVEVWPVAADQAGLWLLDERGPWMGGPVMSDDEPHSEVEYVLSEHGGLSDVLLIHSTSWRVDRRGVLLTYMTVIGVGDDFVSDRWPNARPIGAALMTAVGKPIPHEPTEAPWPDAAHVMFHGLRHLRFLMDHDTANAAALNDHWRTHLAPLTPALARMYLEGEVA